MGIAMSLTKLATATVAPAALIDAPTSIRAFFGQLQGVKQ
jgi:hypothetical protein